MCSLKEVGEGEPAKGEVWNIVSREPPRALEVDRVEICPFKLSPGISCRVDDKRYAVSKSQLTVVLDVNWITPCKGESQIEVVRAQRGMIAEGPELVIEIAFGGGRS
jgi:hypothetical protein